MHVTRDPVSHTPHPPYPRYAHDTQHEKIIRGLSLALAMTMYAREEEAEALITTLLHDKDAILRYVT